MRSWLNSHDPKWLISKRPLTVVMKNVILALLAFGFLHISLFASSLFADSQLNVVLIL